MGDSLIRGMSADSILHTSVQCFRGVTIERLTSKVVRGLAVVKDFKACIILVGTNDVAGLEPEEFLAKYRNLLLAIRDKNPSI